MFYPPSNTRTQNSLLGICIPCYSTPMETSSLSITDGATTIPYNPNLELAVSEAEQSWRSFCNLTLEQKKGFPYIENVGYEHKDESNGSDLKENFHVTIGALRRLAREMAKTNCPEATKFIASVTALAEFMEEAVREYCEFLEKKYEITGIADRILRNKGGWTFRFLHYFPGTTSGKEIAAPHADKGGFTFHLRESTGGIQYLNPDKSWESIAVLEDETVLFSGMQMQFASAGKVIALCHRVVANEISEAEGRFSVVCFVDMANTPSYDKKTHGRMQDHEPGFNYEMSFEEFSKLFAK
ncbi:hypothetical protein COB55_05490 [Candidatus Wolfebacteria bacterium]|nr:MAG: hypothetical protein COB55_05490 [Candidatus Wolfebacteria bacterium]